MHEKQEAAMRKLTRSTMQEDAFLKNAQADNDVLQETVDLFVDRGWLNPYSEEHLFIHDETNFYPGNEQKLIDLLVAVIGKEDGTS